MAFCTNCGASVDGEFCGSCGTKVEASAPPAGTPAPAAMPPVNIGAPKKKRGPLFWILTGCGTLVVLAAIVVMVGGWWAYRAVKQAGLDPELMEKNPAMAVAKLMAVVNPDIEVLSVDDARGVIKVRDKKSGKILSVNLADAKKGKITFEDEEGGKIDIQAQGEGDKASIDIKGAKGEMTLGANTKLPDWLPSYPGAEGAGSFGVSGSSGSAASYAFKTNDAVEDVATFYEDALKNAGLEVEKKGQGAGAVVSAKDSGPQRTANIVITRQGDATSVFMTFESKK